jgi:hypothetical protein
MNPPIPSGSMTGMSIIMSKLVVYAPGKILGYSPNVNQQVS